MCRTLALAVSLVVLLAALVSAATPVKLPDGEGKKIVETRCASCHGLDVLNGKESNQLEWQALVDAMIDRGATLNKQDAATVVAYLAKNFGVKDRGKKLVEDICSLCHEWQRVKEQQLTREQWSGVIKGMIFEGAPVTDEEFNLIVEYLAKNYGATKD